MIKSFKCKDTERLYERNQLKQFQSFSRVARRKLKFLHDAVSLDDLRTPPANHLEKLKGDRLGQYSIRINNQWRVCFRFENDDTYDVEIVDYH